MTILTKIYRRLNRHMARDCTLDEVGDMAIRMALEDCGYNKTAAAKQLGIGRSKMTEWIKLQRKKAAAALCLCASVVQAATLSLPSPPTRLAVAAAPAPTNKPLEIYFDAWPTNGYTHFTNASGTSTVVLTNSFHTNGPIEYLSNATLTVTMVQRQKRSAVTNLMATCSVGTNRDAALVATNFFVSVITNRGPVRFWLPPTNRYVVSLFALTADRQRWIWAQADWPAAPSNQVRFVWNLLFSDRMEKPTHQWTQGDQTYSFTLTNGVNMGTNRFVRAIGTAILDDFTPKAVMLDQGTIGIFTNSP